MNIMTEPTDDEKRAVSDYERFVEKAKISAAIVSPIASFDDAVAYVVELISNRPLNRYAIDDEPVKTEGLNKVVAAPALSQSERDTLERACREHSIDCVTEGLRSHMAGVDVGLTYADIGLAETGTLVLNCPDEQLRLATMLCEYHVCILPRSAIVADGYAAEERLKEFMLDAPTYTAFITGPSRTADIERVLSIGVHGPLELHILILED
jgi:L-lactate dehydrogenase complex protein LldG